MPRILTRLIISVRLFFARRTAKAAEAKARALRIDIDARTARMYEYPSGSDHRGFAAAGIYLDLSAVHGAEDAARRASARVAELAKQRGDNAAS